MTHRCAEISHVATKKNLLRVFFQKFRVCCQLLQKHCVFLLKCAKKMSRILPKWSKNVAYFAKMLKKMSRILPKCLQKCVFCQNVQKHVAYFTKMVKKMSRILPKCSKKCRVFCQNAQKKCSKKCRVYFWTKKNVQNIRDIFSGTFLLPAASGGAQTARINFEKRQNQKPRK